MSTWEDLRKDILFALGEKREASATNDIRAQVDRKLQMKRDEVYGLRAPRSLLVYSTSVDIPSTLDYISIDASGSGDTPGWSLTDYWRLYSITMGQSDAETIHDGQEWEYVEWDTWIKSASAVEGDQRLSATYTVDYQNRVYLIQLPDGTSTWKAWLNYYKQPAAIVDAGIPEIGVEFENVLTLGTILEFPDLFRGDERAGIYAATARRYDDALKSYLRANTPKRSGSRLRPFRKKRGTSPLFWGGLQTS